MLIKLNSVGNLPLSNFLRSPTNYFTAVIHMKCRRRVTTNLWAPGPQRRRGGYFKGSSTSNSFAANLQSAAIPCFPLVSSRPRASFEIFVCYCNEQNMNLFVAIIDFVQNFRNLFPELMDLRSTTINMRIPRKLCKLRRCTSNRIVC